jgi:ribosomal-protein-alanine N-acetyltransferase
MSITERAVTAAADAVSISKMREHDLLEVVEIEESSGLSRWGWTAYYAELQGSNGSLMLVARVNKTETCLASHSLAGYIVARMGAEELHINNFAVRDEYRRRGIGRELLNRILEAGKRYGAQCAFLELRAGNTAARALYEECGFRLTSRRQRYYSDPVEDALVMISKFERSA